LDDEIKEPEHSSVRRDKKCLLESAYLDGNEKVINTKTDVKEMGFEDGRWIELAQDCVQWWALILEVLNLWFYYGRIRSSGNI
jgi:hypothetical protein